MQKRNFRLKSMVAAVLAAATLLVPLTGAIAEATTIKARSNVNVRSGSTSLAEKVGYVYAGQVAKYLGTENGWYKIELDGTVGYTHGNYWVGNTVTAVSNVNVRKADNNLADKVAYAAAGTEASVLGRSGSWLYIDLNGVKGYSYKSYWDLSDTLFYSLSVVTGEAVTTPPVTEPEPAPVQPEAPANPDVVTAGDPYKIYSAIPGHINAADAEAGINVIRNMSSGTYYVYKVYSGMYNVSTVKGVAGAWINPARNAYEAPPVTAPPSTDPPVIVPPAEPTPEPTPEPPAVEDPTDQGEVTTGDDYSVRSQLAGYGTAAHAADRTSAVTTLAPGMYYVYKIFGGMYNISTVKSVPGAWINPADNNGTDAPSAPVSESDSRALGERIVNNAKAVLGTPYVWGGESLAEGGFDCSGLTYYAYNKEGIRLPRTASQQWAGIANKVSVPQPGDIIAFERDGKIYHAGIFLGDGTMIHAPEPGKFVEIKSLEWHYRNNLVKGYLRPTK